MTLNLKKTKGAPKNNLPRDACLHLLSMVALYWSAISFIALCWEYVNYFFPDALADRYADVSGAMRFEISSLLIVFPVFIWVSWFLNKLYVKEPQTRESKIRKWLLYLTLFITALVMIIDLVCIINTFLSGGMTLRFILKALSMLTVIGFIFVFYLDDVKRGSALPEARYFAWITSAVVFASVVGSFLIIGSPMETRQIKFDAQRINNLKNIQFQLVNYWRNKSQLPTQLSDLNNPISDYSVPLDPQTHVPYEYFIQDPATLSFELCAVFNTKSMPSSASEETNSLEEHWNHSAGRVCFHRSIDKQVYPPRQGSHNE